MYLLGYDIGSSSIKACLMDGETGAVVASASSPQTELEIVAPHPGWAEQDPETWWQHVKVVTAQIKDKGIDPADIKAIGISYQMHGLVAVDKAQQVLRPAIIWCDSRAVRIGEAAAEALGHEQCLKRLLNYPGNFTASKLKWVMENEPALFEQIYKIMLPGDYIAMRLTGEIKTTVSGLSEGIMWDFQTHGPAQMVLEHYGFDADLLGELTATFSVQGELTKPAAAELGLAEGTVVSYRAGDQPNNAFSLKVLAPGEIAATAGTSGVVYGISDRAEYDPQSRVNTFVHVNDTAEVSRHGVLLCVNGTGILNSWLKHNMMCSGEDYEKMNQLAEEIPVGCDGLAILPYGNGAERTLENRDIGATVCGCKFNTHRQAHILRAAQEGIVFALNYGLEIMRQMGVNAATIRAGNANMFLSELFGSAFATVSGACVELFNTDGAQGAARGAGIGAGIYRNQEEAFVGLDRVKVIEPDATATSAYHDAYQNWRRILNNQLNNG